MDGKGGFYTVELTNVTSSIAKFSITAEEKRSRTGHQHIAIAPTKNSDRIEWFVEKACELGVHEISFILTQNSERPKVRIDRLEKKAVSALKQSKSGFITRINPVLKVSEGIKNAKEEIKLIAYVQDDLPHVTSKLNRDKTSLVLIGPEGDFDQKEVSLAEQSGFIKVSLGENVLRTETAGLAVAVWMSGG